MRIFILDALSFAPLLYISSIIVGAYSGLLSFSVCINSLICLIRFC